MLTLNEFVTNGYNAEFLDIISLISVFCAILVIITKNPIISVLYLIGLFFSISCYLMILGINYIGLAYLLVYVGAVSVLFLFILMLINVRISELLGNTNNSIPLAIITIIIFNYCIQESISLNMDPQNNLSIINYRSIIKKLFTDSLFIINNKNYNYNNNNDNINYITSSTWDGNLSEISHIGSIGNIMYTSYSMWLIITSIILLLAMVGAIVITIKQKQ